MPLITLKIEGADMILSEIVSVFVEHGQSPRNGIALMAYLAGSNAASNSWKKQEVLASIAANFELGWDDELAEQAKTTTARN